MKLGGSLERRRGRHRRGAGRGGDASPSPLTAKLVGWIAGLAVGGWLLGYLVATQLLFPAPPPPGDMHPVPDVRGLTVASAIERLEGEGLTLGSVDSLLHPSVPVGTILGQSPLPEQIARPGSAVRVTASLGPQTRSVPDVVTLLEDRARVVLETSGFLVTRDTVESEMERGRVVEIFPPPAEVVSLPSEVTMVVSTGPPVIPMPFVLGLDEEEARMLLDSLGLVVSEVEEVFRFGRDQGIVVEQEPPSETALERGASVRLSVGRRGSAGGNNGLLRP